jgi:hypothetical protein
MMNDVFIRQVVLSDRYEYTLHGSYGEYYVTCKDKSSRHALRHPRTDCFTLEQAHAFIDKRVERVQERV